MTNTSPTSDEQSTATKNRTLTVTDVDAELREAIEESAKANRRSMAAEANIRLRQSFGLDKAA